MVEKDDKLQGGSRKGIRRNEIKETSNKKKRRKGEKTPKEVV